MTAAVLVLCDSREGLVAELARAVCSGVESVDGVELRARTVDEARPEELLEADGLILGSPNWTGITGKLKEWMDRSGDLWKSGELAASRAAPSRRAGRRTAASRRHCCS